MTHATILDTVRVQYVAVHLCQWGADLPPDLPTAEGVDCPECLSMLPAPMAAAPTLPARAWRAITGRRPLRVY